MCVTFRVLMSAERKCHSRVVLRPHHPAAVSDKELGVGPEARDASENFPVLRPVDMDRHRVCPYTGPVGPAELEWRGVHWRVWLTGANPSGYHHIRVVRGSSIACPIGKPTHKKLRQARGIKNSRSSSHCLSILTPPQMCQRHHTTQKCSGIYPSLPPPPHRPQNRFPQSSVPPSTRPST